MNDGIKAGDILTNRDGTRVAGPAMSFRAPFWIYEAGVASVGKEESPR